jgi:urease accessory protein
MKAALHIQASARNGITYLKQNYFSPPFKVANITEDKKANELQLMLMSSSPGILDGDEYDIKIEVDEHSVLQLHTQSYQRLFNMKVGATQKMEVVLNSNSSFTYLPHPTVPHEQSIFSAKNKIHLQSNCKLIWGEILTCGRKLNGEVFLLSKYHNLTEIYFNNKLVIKENLLIQPTIANPAFTGQMEGYTHQASLIMLDAALDIASAKETIAGLLSLKEGIEFGITAAHINGLIIRILGNKAEQLLDCLKEVTAKLKSQKINQPAFA